METFTLDTSGAVLSPPGPTWPMRIIWSDLSPFAQGYVEAMLRGPIDLRGSVYESGGGTQDTLRLGFSDLAPETLATILGDCEAFERVGAGRLPGGLLWKTRQTEGAIAQGMPPLTLYLDDTGKVRLREAA